MADLLAAELEIAVPARDRGVDLIAYAELGSRVKNFSAVPIQMKAFSARGFGINRKYEKISNLLLAFVWEVAAPTSSTIYVMNYIEALAVADTLGWTATESWRRGAYVTTTPSRRAVALLEQYRATPRVWWERVVGQTSAQP
jgi:hypothetical protein